MDILLQGLFIQTHLIQIASNLPSLLATGCEVVDGDLQYGGTRACFELVSLKCIEPSLPKFLRLQ